MHLWFGKGGWASKKARQQLKQLQPADIKSIAVIRHAALGDMLLTRPFLVECRRLYPNASITLSVTSNYQRGTPEDLIDRVHVVHGSDQRKVGVVQQLKKYRELGQHDIIFDLAATPRSFWTCFLNKAKFKVGFPYGVFQRYIFYNIFIPRSDFRFEADNLLDMLNAMGAKTKWPLDFAFNVKPIEVEKDYILIFPSASTPTRCWERSKVIELVGKLASANPDLDIYLLAGRADWEKVDDIINALPEYKNVLAKECNDYGETLACIRTARLVVANDTGIRHMAIALSTPSVGIFFDESVNGSTPFRYWPRYSLHEAVFTTDGKQPDVNDVFESITDLLQRVSG